MPGTVLGTKHPVNKSEKVLLCEGEKHEQVSK